MTGEPRIELLTDEQTDRYLQRIGVDARRDPSDQWLRELHLRHLQSVPFENLSIHLDEPISLAQSDLLDKIVRRRRGGFCYEVNGLFASLLQTVGFDVELLAAAVYSPDGLGPPFDHLAMSVRTPVEDHVWLADVGFGRHSAHPLRLGAAGEQRDPHGLFELTTTPAGDTDVYLEQVAQYRLESRPRALADFAPTCWWQQTWPDSHFRTGPVCSMLTHPGGWVTLAGRTLIVTDAGKRTETNLETDTETLAAYEQYFGVQLDRLPASAQTTSA